MSEDSIVIDKEILEFLESWTTLHYSVEMLYVVDGYTIVITYDGNHKHGPYKGENLREALAEAVINLGKRRI